MTLRWTTFGPYGEQFRPDEVRLTGDKTSDERDVMAAKRKVSITTGPTNHRQSSSERHAAYVAQIANRQTELKDEAAARRAKRAAEDEASPETLTEAPPETTRNQ